MFPTCQALAALAEQPEEEQPQEDAEEPLESDKAEDEELGEFSKMLADMDEQDEAAGGSNDSKTNDVEAVDLEALVEHWFQEPMAT